jgi:hypothetical protein
MGDVLDFFRLAMPTGASNALAESRSARLVGAVGSGMEWS